MGRHSGKGPEMGRKNNDEKNDNATLDLRGVERRLNGTIPLSGISLFRGRSTEPLFRNDDTFDFCFELTQNREIAKSMFDGKPYSYVCPHAWIRTPEHSYAAIPNQKSKDAFTLIYGREHEEFFRNRILRFDRMEYSFIMTSSMIFLLNEISIRLNQSRERYCADRLDYLAMEFIYESILNVRSGPEHNPITSDENKWNLLIDVAVYIDNHIQDSLDIDVVCKKFSISRRTFFRYWRRHFGSTPAAYIARKRLELSAHLILNTNLNLYEIAEYCGFSSLSYFCLQFKKKYGVSANEYRRNWKHRI